MSNERAAVKTLNRTALTKALVAHLKHDEAVIGGIGTASTTAARFCWRSRSTISPARCRPCATRRWSRAAS
jgi:hypothetical protein